MAGKQVTIGKHKVKLAAPASFTIRHEIVAAATNNWRRAFGAALGACWRGSSRPKCQYHQADYNPMKYGGMVLDELAERGEDLAQVLEAGGAAFKLLAKDLISEDEVSAVEDFTDPAED